MCADAAREVSRSGIFIIQRCCRFPECSLENFIMESQPHYGSQTTLLSSPLLSAGFAIFQKCGLSLMRLNCSPFNKSKRLIFHSGRGAAISFLFFASPFHLLAPLSDAKSTELMPLCRSLH